MGRREIGQVDRGRLRDNRSAARFLHRGSSVLGCTNGSMAVKESRYEHYSVSALGGVWLHRKLYRYSMVALQLWEYEIIGAVLGAVLE